MINTKRAIKALRKELEKMDDKEREAYFEKMGLVFEKKKKIYKMALPPVDVFTEVSKPHDGVCTYNCSSRGRVKIRGGLAIYGKAPEANAEKTVVSYKISQRKGKKVIG